MKIEDAEKIIYCCRNGLCSQCPASEAGSRCLVTGDKNLAFETVIDTRDERIAELERQLEDEKTRLFDVREHYHKIISLLKRKRDEARCDAVRIAEILVETDHHAELYMFTEVEMCHEIIEKYKR